MFMGWVACVPLVWRRVTRLSSSLHVHSYPPPPPPKQQQEKRIEDAIRSIRQQYEDVLERKQEEYVEKYKHLQYIEVRCPWNNPPVKGWIAMAHLFLSLPPLPLSTTECLDRGRHPHRPLHGLHLRLPAARLRRVQATGRERRRQDLPQGGM